MTFYSKPFTLHLLLHVGLLDCYFLITHVAQQG